MAAAREAASRLADAAHDSRLADAAHDDSRHDAHDRLDIRRVAARVLAMDARLAPASHPVVIFLV
jgi:hypothetical protein